LIDRIFQFVAKIHGGGKDKTEVAAEWHSIVQGFAEVLCPWPPRHKEMHNDLLNEIKDEHHYYVAGRVGGALLLLRIIIAVIERFM